LKGCYILSEPIKVNSEKSEDTKSQAYVVRRPGRPVQPARRPQAGGARSDEFRGL